MFDEDILADVKINLVNVPVNIDRQIVSGMRMPLVASATRGTMQAILMNAVVRGLTRGRAGHMARPTRQRAERFSPGKFKTSAQAHQQLIRQTDREWKDIVKNADNPQQLKRESVLFYNRLRSRIGNYQVDRVKRGEISLEQAIPRPTGGRLEPTRALQRRQSALEDRAPESTKFVESVQPSSTSRTIPATITGNINPRTTQFTQRQTEVFNKGNEYGNIRQDLLRRGVLDLGGANSPGTPGTTQRLNLQRQREMFRERREASEAATRPINRNDGGSSDDVRFREGK